MKLCEIVRNCVQLQLFLSTTELTPDKALYPLLGSVISVSTINRVILQAQQRVDAHRQSQIAQTLLILIVDGFWVEIQYTLEGFKV